MPGVELSDTGRMIDEVPWMLACVEEKKKSLFLCEPFVFTAEQEIR
jgi:hypothetical protein